MRINFIVPNIAKLGGVRIMMEYASRLIDKGHDVKIYEPVLPYNYQRNFSFYWFLRSLYIRFKEILREKTIIRDFSSPNIKTNVVPLISNFFIKKADFNIAINWVTARNLNKLSPQKGKNIYFIQAYETFVSDEELIKDVYKLPMVKFVVSSFLRELLQNKYSVESCLILNGLNYSTFFNETKCYFRDYRRIIFIEHGLYTKRVDNILNIIEKLNNNYLNLKFSSFGIKRYHDLPEYIEFFQNPDDGKIRELFSSSDIFIGASESEGFYLSPAEAMACKCAVVVSKVGAVPEYSTHLESAMHFEPRDEEAMYNNICYLLNNPDELKRISENGYKEIRNKLNWDKSIARFEQLLSNL